MKEYEIVYASTLIKLVEKVNEKLQQGWKLRGNLLEQGEYYKQVITRKIT
jgi:hypothetical protein